MDHDDFDNVSWRDEPMAEQSRSTSNAPPAQVERQNRKSSGKKKPAKSSQAGPSADAVDLGGIGDGRLDCTVTTPLKENEGTKDVYVSYLVTTHTDFASFQNPESKVRRRFTDFVFLYKALVKDYPASAVPPLPDKHKMEYVRGDRFGSDFTSRRAYSLARFLNRISLHPVLRRATLLTVFLESNDWNAHMRLRPQRERGMSEQTSIFDNLTDSFVSVFSKNHKPDKRFIEVREKADKLADDLSQVEKIVARVARREADLEADYSDLSTQFLRLATLEPEVERPVHVFAQSVAEMAKGIQVLKEHIDQNYLGSLRDMDAYILSVKGLLKGREQKQVDFEDLTEYLTRAAQDRDTLASSPSYPTGPTSFIRSKIEDVRGVDHEQSRRERVRKLEMTIERLTREVEEAKRVSEMFDEEVVREVEDWERIKNVEFRTTLGDLASKHIEFYEGTREIWERFLGDMEAEEGHRGDGRDDGA